MRGLELMGIDATDILFKLEYRLGVKLNGPALAWTGTVADLAASVAEQIGSRRRAKPPGVEFEEFRQLLCRCAELQPDQISESTRWTELLGPGLPRVWRRIRRERPELPELDLTRGVRRWKRWLAWILLTLSLGLALATAALGQPTRVALACVVPGLVGIVIISVLFARLKDQLPAGIDRIGDVLPLLAPTFAPGEPGELTLGQQLMRDEAVVRLVREVLVDSLAVEYGKTRLDARLREDLGMS